MKNIFYLVIGLFFVSGCSLKEEILDTLTSDNAISKQADVTAFLNGTYATLQTDGGFKANYAIFWSTADDINIRPGIATNLPYSIKTHDSATPATNNFWNTMYATINRCNFLLEKIEPLNINAAYKTRVKGELYFLRAFSYFYLVRLFGNVPLRLKATALTDDLTPERASVDKVYEQIFADLKLASNTLLTRTTLPVAEFGHATKGAAQAMLAKAYLTYASHQSLKGVDAVQNYTLAKVYADSVINSNQYKLIASYNDLFDIAKERAAYEEVIFGISFTRDAQLGALGSQFAGFFLPTTMPNVAGQGTSKTGIENYVVQPWFYDKYSSGDYLNDYRVERSFLTTWTNTANRKTITYPLLRASTTSNEVIQTTTVQPFIYKYVDGAGITNSNQENDLFIIRLADVYLIKAEAENEVNGPTPAAYAAFNLLRARARNANGTIRTTPANLTAGLTKDEFRMKVFDERALELFAEGHRWFDLVRFKAPNGKSMMEYQFGTFLPTLKAGLPVYNNTARRWDGGVTEPNSLPAFNARFMLLPIPQSEIVANPKITQNTGY
ncbi:RagB/SusD family nutrient uptake outer membrane protein [Flectobacillus roseus]|uniref:RagB/SusD family nutrient uptake outer membrane protein n=1 Tax=Flectobacillus roseus TaxID=502259 RepID=A0ABT6Y716_9BACT|nr:RagB/SusD family nutrient uptake outer membrane protein [Flectobacillus roseus]MDI9859367.1 RagB/SusD family nutrient uptake outer membrane protein [Flectobacillus roseus]